MNWSAFTFIAILMVTGTASAKPRCLDLTRTQAETAVAVMKRASAKGSSLIYYSSKERGLVKPLSLWAEPSNKRRSFRVRIDNRPIDISLVYVSRSPGERKAWNVGWLAGCRPAPDKPIAIDNF